MREPFQPTNIDNYGDSLSISAGPYIRVDGSRVSLNGSGGSGEVAVFDGNSLRGQKLSIKSVNQRILRVERRGLDFTLKPQGGIATIITGIALSDNDGLVITKREGFIHDLGLAKTERIPYSTMTCVKRAEYDGSALKFQHEFVQFLGNPPQETDLVTIPIVDCVV